MSLPSDAAVLIYISDARPEYVQNALRTSALPHGAIIRYRYHKKWFNSEIWDMLIRSNLQGAGIVVSYLQGNEPGLPAAQATPVRLGVISSAHAAGNFGIFDVELHGFYGSSAMASVTNADPRGLTSPGPADMEYVTKINLLRPIADANQILSWQETVEKLSAMGNLNAQPFIYFQGIIDPVSDNFLPIVNGVIRMSAAKEYSLRIFALWPGGGVGVQDFKVEVDDSLLKLRSPSELRVGYKFDEFNVRISARSASFRGSDHVRIAPIPPWNFPTLSVEVKVLRSRFATLLRLGIPGLSAATAASAALLPSDVPIWAKTVMVAAGSAGIAISSARTR